MSNAKSALRDSARFIRLRGGDIYFRTPMLENAKGSVLVSDDEAREYFIETGREASLGKIGLAVAAEAKAADKPKGPAKGRAKAADKKPEPEPKPEPEKASEPDTDDEPELPLTDEEKLLEDVFKGLEE